MIVVKVFGQNALQMALAKYDHVVQALTADGSDQTFGVRILPRRPRGGDYFLDAHVLHPVTEVPAVDAVPVAKQKTRSFLERKHFDDLLSGPPGSRVCRHIEVDDASTFMLEDHEDVQHAERDRWYREEVGSSG